MDSELEKKDFFKFFRSLKRLIHTPKIRGNSKKARNKFWTLETCKESFRLQNSDSESDNSDSDSKKYESAFLELNQVQSYKNSGSVQSHVHSKTPTQSSKEFIRNLLDTIGSPSEFVRSLSRVSDSETSGLELNLVVTFGSLIFIS